MPTFGIIGEGITDQIVIEQVVLGCFDDADAEPVLNYVQPLLDRTGQSSAPEPGGWTLVLRYLQLGKHREALQFNDYLIMHIDTDTCDEKGYDIPRTEEGRVLAPEELAGRVVEKLRGLIGADVLEGHGHRPRAYLDAARPYADGRTLRKLAGKNPSLSLFVAQVAKVATADEKSAD
jgi:hypothetical protein